jgi:hypothetical protein
MLMRVHTRALTSEALRSKSSCAMTALTGSLCPLNVLTFVHAFYDDKRHVTCTSTHTINKHTHIHSHHAIASMSQCDHAIQRTLSVRRRARC